MSRDAARTLAAKLTDAELDAVIRELHNARLDILELTSGLLPRDKRATLSAYVKLCDEREQRGRGAHGGGDLPHRYDGGRCVYCGKRKP